jgi:hypothetical protein
MLRPCLGVAALLLVAVAALRDLCSLRTGRAGCTGRRLVVAVSGEPLRVWNLKSGKPQAIAHPGAHP